MCSNHFLTYTNCHLDFGRIPKIFVMRDATRRRHIISSSSTSKINFVKCFYLHTLFQTKDLLVYTFIAHSQENVCTIVRLLFCYKIAIIRIIVKLQQKVYCVLEVWNSRVTKSSHKKELRKMTSHFELLENVSRNSSFELLIRICEILN